MSPNIATDSSRLIPRREIATPNYENDFSLSIGFATLTSGEISSEVKPIKTRSQWHIEGRKINLMGFGRRFDKNPGEQILKKRSNISFCSTFYMD